MYNSYFGFAETPFTITPDAKFLYMSPRHGDALAHLKYGLFESNGFVLLTGEVGTGKTVLCRCVLEQLPEAIDAALILNPRQTALELMANICDELHIRYPENVDSIKLLIDLLNAHLLENHAKGRCTVLIIDEAQNLSVDVLEQVRLLTNLETSKHKLLQILLIGQPELDEILARPQMRQLNQRITARYHIPPLTQTETAAYIQHRLAVAGVQRPLFTKEAATKIYRLSKGIPRLINIICDRALLGAYAENAALVGPRIVVKAAHEVLTAQRRDRFTTIVGVLVGAMLLIALGMSAYTFRLESADSANGQQVQQSDVTELEPPALDSHPALPAAEGGSSIKPSDDVTAMPDPENQAATTVPEAPASGAEATTAELASALKVGHDSPAEIAEATMDEVVVAESGPIASTAPAAQSGVVADDLLALLDDPRCASTTDHGIAALFRLWGKSYEPQPGRTACQVADQEGLHCLDGKGTWNNLHDFNRPAIVEMRGPQGNWQHIVATAIEDDSVVLSCADKTVKVDVAAADQYWFGEYLLLWKSPGLRKRLVPGDRGRDVLMLREQLEKVLGISASEAVDPRQRTLFDEGLRMLVIQFQRKYALQPDGIAGKATMMLLNTLTRDASVPMLDRSAL